MTPPWPRDLGVPLLQHHGQHRDWRHIAPFPWLSAAKWRCSTRTQLRSPGEFCLVECVSIDNGRADQELREESGSAGGVPQCGCFMYRLKTFSLVYDAKRDLKLKNSRGRCYMLPQKPTSYLHEDPVAFWLWNAKIKRYWVTMFHSGVTFASVF